MSQLRVMTIRAECDKVQIIQQGKMVSEMTWQEALNVANALQAQARKAEEWAKAEQIAYDSALLLRAGLPALTDNPHILRRAHQIATYDLPRYMPKDKRR